MQSEVVSRQHAGISASSSCVAWTPANPGSAATQSAPLPGWPRPSRRSDPRPLGTECPADLPPRLLQVATAEGRLWSPPRPNSPTSRGLPSSRRRRRRNRAKVLSCERMAWIFCFCFLLLWFRNASGFVFF